MKLGQHLRIWFTIMAFFLPFSANLCLAESYCLELKRPHGPTVHFKIDESVYITVRDSVFLITSSDQFFQCQIDDLKGFTYKKNCTADVEATTISPPTVKITSDGILISGIDKGNLINFFISDMSGRIVSQGTCHDEIRLRKQDFAPGIYILKADDLPAIKFIIKA